MEGLTDETALPESALRKAAAVKSESKETAVHAAEAVRDTAARAVRTAREHTPKEALDRAGHVTGQARGAAVHVGHFAADHTPPQLREQADRAAGAARANRTPLLVALAAAVIAAALVRGLLGGRR